MKNTTNLQAYLVVYGDGVEVDARRVEPGTWATADFRSELYQRWCDHHDDVVVRQEWRDEYE